MKPNATIAAAALLTAGLALAAGPSAARQDEPESRRATATFAGGCFWCMEEAFDGFEGVASTTSGYIGGHVANPTYRQVTTGSTGHAEAIEIEYDPSRIGYERLLAAFWRNIDPLDAGGQFCDRGSQYRSAVFYHSPEQQRLAEASKREVEQRLGQPVATTIVEAGRFYRAEDYHQNYYEKNPVRYKFYKWSCGRAQRLDRLWGSSSQ